MIKIPPLLLLFLSQFLVIFIGLTIFLFFRYRNVNINGIISRGEASRLKNELEEQKKISIEYAGWEDKFRDLQAKFEHIKNINAKLKAYIDEMVPKAQRTEEYEWVVRDMEKSYAELDTYMEGLREEKKRFARQSESFQDDVDKLSHKLEQSVSKEEFEQLQADNKKLELKINKLTSELEEKTSEVGTLQKNYIWLEKEYNALYENISGS